MSISWLLHMMKPSCEATMNRSVIDLRELSGRRRGWVVGGVVGEGASDGGGQVTGDVGLAGDGSTHPISLPALVMMRVWMVGEGGWA